MCDDADVCAEADVCEEVDTCDADDTCDAADLFVVRPNVRNALTTTGRRT